MLSLNDVVKVQSADVQRFATAGTDALLNAMRLCVLRSSPVGRLDALEGALIEVGAPPGIVGVCFPYDPEMSGYLDVGQPDQRRVGLLLPAPELSVSVNDRIRPVNPGPVR